MTDAIPVDYRVRSLSDLVPDSSGAFYRTLSLLRLSLRNGETFFVVNGIATKDDSDLEVGDLQGTSGFFYEEHQCPTNFIPVEAIVADGDFDPHGLFEHVRTEWMPKAYAENRANRVDILSCLFPELTRRSALECEDEIGAARNAVGAWRAWRDAQAALARADRTRSEDLEFACLHERDMRGHAAYTLDIAAYPDTGFMRGAETFDAEKFPRGPWSPPEPR